MPEPQACQDIGFLVKQIHDALERTINRELEAFQLTNSQLTVLNFLQFRANAETTIRDVQEYMNMIAHELEHPIDKFSKPLIISNIEVLLNYCMRFYERQFITREELNNDVLVRFEQLLNEYWDSGMAELHGLPTVKYFADKICLSPNYFGDLVKSETGKTAREHIHLKIIELAKTALFEPNASIKQIADKLGFQYPQHFLRFFKKEVGCTPKEYRIKS